MDSSPETSTSLRTPPKKKPAGGSRQDPAVPLFVVGRCGDQFGDDDLRKHRTQEILPGGEEGMCGVVWFSVVFSVCFFFSVSMGFEGFKRSKALFCF